MRVLETILTVMFGIGLFSFSLGCSTSDEKLEDPPRDEDENSDDIEGDDDIEDEENSNTERNTKTNEETEGGDADSDSDSDTDTDADTDSDSDADKESDQDTDSKDKQVSDSDKVDEVDTNGLEKFSFFLTSNKALQELSGNQNGFGGDLRFGETGPGAGLRGADKICATIAEKSMPGSKVKKWRAFLSATDNGKGERVHAIDRIGEGPWYDRKQRLLAPTKQDLISIRPMNGDPAIKNDFPNEDGVPNHYPEGKPVDNHDVLTGTNQQGKLFSATATCLDWTTSEGKPGKTGRPRVGHSWPSIPGAGNLLSGGMNSWMSALTESGCAPGGVLIQSGPPQPQAVTVGSGGGYGGFYCFALVP